MMDLFHWFPESTFAVMKSPGPLVLLITAASKLHLYWPAIYLDLGCFLVQSPNSGGIPIEPGRCWPPLVEADLCVACIPGMWWTRAGDGAAAVLERGV